ncbi:hypothetical protein PGT21_026307 [Puccinia graminis f. sp. tritici]|uniref:HAT C-terminal dimerisation domain-containing protein n=1 Tax=Puccinia graminis f. sp. tritici TaxID=56615 RepID=A0A5B0PCD1_PUCGR|nr:hypothetical protein PGT21_026307 [Puccinia graminis f. sp. tritici]
MAHVINLAAHNGLKAVGCKNIEVAGEQEVTLNRMDLNAIVNQPNGANVNLKTIISHIHGLATYVRGSPQRRETFQATINFVNKQNKRRKPIEVQSLRLDVWTQWNSTYLILQRALKLKSVCLIYCGSRGDAPKYALLPVEWEKLKQITQFLKPLHKVTNILCRSKYPTLTMALPIYIALIKTICRIRLQYDAAQLIPAADEMVNKLMKYLILAPEKPAPIYMTPENALAIFKSEAKSFDRSPSRMANDLTAEVNQYIAEVNERESCDTLAYWTQNKKVYPSLSLMASCYLGIPATSAPSEQVSSQSKTIIGPQ